MSAGLRNTTIERFRRRAHGASTLNLYQLAADGESLVLLTTLDKGFFIAPRSRKDMRDGAPNHDMAIDVAFNPTVTEDLLRKIFLAELVSDTRTRRFRLNKEDAPISDDTRYVIGLHSAFNNAQPVI